MNTNRFFSTGLAALLLLGFSLTIVPTAIADGHCDPTTGPAPLGDFSPDEECLEDLPVDPDELPVGPDTVTGAICGVLGTADGDDMLGVQEILCAGGGDGGSDCPSGADTGNDTNICASVVEAAAFEVIVNDGGSGLDLGTVDAGDSADTSSSPLNVTFNNSAADDLVVDLGEFQNETGAITFTAEQDGASQSQVCAYDNEADASEGTPFSNAAVCEFFAAGSATIDLDGNGLGGDGSSLYLVFEIHVPSDASTEDYTAPVDISAIEL